VSEDRHLLGSSETAKLVAIRPFQAPWVITAGHRERERSVRTPTNSVAPMMDPVKAGTPENDPFQPNRIIGTW